VAGAGFTSFSRSDAGISRFRSRSRMYSSYFAVPGRGGASAGIPADANTIVVGVWMLEPGEDMIVARRLHEVLSKASHA